MLSLLSFITLIMVSFKFLSILFFTVSLINFDKSLLELLIFDFRFLLIILSKDSYE